MPRTQTATRRIGRSASLQLPLRPRVELVPILVPERISLSADPDIEVVRSGATMRQVACFVMTTALLCLLALVAGRMDASNFSADSHMEAKSGTVAASVTVPSAVGTAAIGN